MWTGNGAEKEGVGNEYAVKIVSNSWTMDINIKRNIFNFLGK